MRMASRVPPLPSPGSSVRGMDPGGGSNVKSESSYAARAVPVKIYLPDGAPVVQEVIPPLTSDGTLFSTSAPELIKGREANNGHRDATTTPPPPLPSLVAGTLSHRLSHRAGCGVTAGGGDGVVVGVCVWGGRVVTDWRALTRRLRRVGDDVSTGISHLSIPCMFRSRVSRSRGSPTPPLADSRTSLPSKTWAVLPADEARLSPFPPPPSPHPHTASSTPHQPTRPARP